ncbi:hypothetical protein CH367_09285 [Leptospira barantonii]|uniref:DUF1554 domain-containing protein n=1 Tax=Leptospira barantonii TaxID=2023184 RepID=A0ABX4NL09_9LEPT|nr:hypothetical protein CH367_09285 [Leptospira barantonii]
MKSTLKSHLTCFSLILVILSFLTIQCKSSNDDNNVVIAALVLLVAQNSAAGGSSDSKLRVFVTATSYDGNLGGINGADTKCSTDANKPSSGTYKAFITGDSGGLGRRYACINDGAVCPSNPTTGAKNWILQASKDYYRVDQATKVFTTDANGLISTVSNPIQATAASFWSGFVATTTDWSAAAGATCGNWQSNAFGNNGNAGQANAATVALKGSTVPACDSAPQKLLCVEQ